MSSQIPSTDINNVNFKCEDVKTLIQQVRRNIAALPKGRHKDMLLDVFEGIQDSLHSIQEEGQKDVALQDAFRQPLWPAEKVSLLIDAHDTVVSQTTAKIVFRSIVDETDIDLIGRLLHVFFHNESIYQLLSDSKMILFFVSTIGGQNTKNKEWKKQVLALFLEIPQVIEAILQSQDSGLEQKLRANIENKTLDMFYKNHRKKRAA